MVWNREVLIFVSQDKHHEKFGVVVEVFNLSRNYRILKVLAHEISDEIPQNLQFSILMVWKREVIIIIPQDQHHDKIGVVVEVFNF